MDFSKPRMLIALFAISGLFLCTAMVPTFFSEFGLDTPVPVNAFLNHNLPNKTPQPAGGGWVLEEAFPNLDFIGPIHMAAEPEGRRILVAEHDGRIWSFSNQGDASEKEIFLNLRERDQVFRQGEAGLLNFAFHPDYGVENFYVYVLYVFKDSSNQRRYDRLSRFEVPIKNGAADPESELVLIHQYDRNNNHNGGGLAFDSEGLLYISLGDEGGGNNPYKNSQSVDDRLFGGVLCIDVDQDTSRSHPIKRQPRRLDSLDQSFTANYFIPDDNPWVSPADSAHLEEFYAIGLRNPHRMTFDEATGEGWIGDVGQGFREEINLLEAGANYEWNFREGERQSQGEKPDSLSLLGKETPPFYTYGHQGGDNCIIGGYVYRGERHPDLVGKYIFADNGSKKIRYLERIDDSLSVQELLIAPNIGTSYRGISAFALDGEGELYVLVMNGSGARGGKIYTLGREEGAVPDPPQWLSETGAFKNTENLVPANFLIPYQPRHPFWSDGALKKRWMAVPNNGKLDSLVLQIDNRSEADWRFPEGSVFIKHFEMPLNANNAQLTRRLETRFLVHGEDGQYYGFTYKWEPDGKDAKLLTTSLDETLNLIDESGNPTSQVWHYPARNECLSCHTQEIGTVLGANTYQLNELLTYPITGRRSNQLSTLSHLGLLSEAYLPEEISSLIRIEKKEDAHLPLSVRARSYLEANCSSCHNSLTGLRSDFDTRFSLPLDSTGLVNGLLVEDGESTDNRLIVPGDTAKSIIYQRLKSLEKGFAMPPIAKNKVDQQGVELIGDWILSMGAKGRLNQSISLEPISDQFVNSPPIPLQAEASSGLPISYRIIQGPARIIQDSLILTGQAGFIILEAYQEGDATYSPSDSIQLSFQVMRLSQQIQFQEVADVLSNAPAISLEAQASSGLPISFTLVSGPATLQGNTLEFSGEEGFITLRADQGGDGTYLPATPIVQIIHVTEFAKSFQEISISPISDKLTLDPPFSLSAVASSGLEVSCSVLEGPAQVFGKSIVLDGIAGQVILAYNQSGNSTFANAEPVLDTFNVARVDQSISFAPLDDISLEADQVVLEATSSSGLPITFTLVEGPATLSGNTLLLDHISDTIIVEATQIGNGSYAPAPPMRRQFFVSKLNQTLTFPPIPDKTLLSSPFVINAYSSSGLSLTYSTEGPGTISNDTLYLTGQTGEITVGVWQVGTDGFEASDTLYQTVSVTKAQQEILFFSIPNLELTQRIFLLRAETNSPFEVVYTAIDGPIEVRNDTLFLLGEEGVGEVEAFLPEDSIYFQATQKQRFTISKVAQDILFGSISDKLVSDDPFLLDVQSSSGLPVSVTLVKGPAIMSGTAIFLTGEPGEVELYAEQEGDDLFQAAQPVTQTFQVIDTSLSLEDSPTTSLAEEVEKAMDLHMYPNPTRDKVQLVARMQQPTAIEIFLYATSGQEILRLSSLTPQLIHHQRIDMESLPAGLYLLRVRDLGGKDIQASSLIYKK